MPEIVPIKTLQMWLKSLQIPGCGASARYDPRIHRADIAAWCGINKKTISEYANGAMPISANRQRILSKAFLQVDRGTLGKVQVRRQWELQVIEKPVEPKSKVDFMKTTIDWFRSST